MRVTANQKVKKEPLDGEHNARPESTWRGGGVDCAGVGEPRRGCCTLFYTKEEALRDL